MAMIATAGLVKRYGEVVALNGLDLAIEGGIVGLLGPNGAGKSTLVKILLGLVRPTAGTAAVLGLDVRRRKATIRRQIGYMPEHESLAPGLDGGGSVYFAARLTGLPHADAMQRAHLVLNYVGMGDERHRKVETYSTGMKQKIKFAQAIVHHPRVLMLDEPTAGLDPRTRVEMLDLIRDAARSGGMHVILSTHILPDVERICDRVAILDRGRLVTQGALADLREADRLAWEVRVRGDVRLFLDALSRRSLGAEVQEGGAVRVSRGNGTVDTRPILEAAVESGVQVRALTPSRSSLEALFSKLVAESRAEGVIRNS
ncbi:MAG: ABC transporter ATP-binding protein [Planctomycetes bacterium]|nr:ABC transporter ATP-binding protein [Planctomycetota bacterium]